METNAPIGERVAVLETKMGEIQHELTDIKGKLDELLHLKSKGMGAFWFVSLIVGSGIFGLFTALVQWFSKPHI